MTVLSHSKEMSILNGIMVKWKISIKIEATVGDKTSEIKYF